MSIRINEWPGRLAEIAANFLLPGLGGMIFDRSHRKMALWQMVLSLAGLVLAGAGAVMLLATFGVAPGQIVDEEQVMDVLNQDQGLYKVLMALAGIIFGGILVLGGFLWSLENAMKRWRVPKVEPPMPPEIPGQE